MTLKSLLSHLDQVDYSPRTLELNLPPNLTESLSGSARAFLEVAFGKTGLTVPELTSDKWKDDPVALDFFVSCEKDVQVEILAFLTLFVHEFTHRIDFLISPFGLQYYVNTLREYWRLQEFFPQMLDNPGTVDHMRFLVGFAETAPNEEIAKTGFQELWEELEGIIHTFYAWGDVSGIKPIGKYIKDGWSEIGRAHV